MSQPPPQADIHLPPDAPVPPPSESERGGLPNWLLAVAAAVLTAAAIGTWIAVPESTAEAAVRSYLEDVRAGDTESAILWLHDPPAETLAEPESLDSDWRIAEIAQVAYQEGHLAEVYAEIEAPDGTGLGHTFEVDLRHEDPLIAQGTTGPVSFRPDSVQINGNSAHGAVVNLLPGVYRFFESSPPSIEMNMPPILALGPNMIELGGHVLAAPFVEARPELTDSGAEQLDSMLRAFIDDCAEAPDVGCPVGSVAEEDGLVPADPESPWRIADYPTAAIKWFTSPDHIRLATLDPGRAELEALVDGETTTVSCPIWVEEVIVRVDWDSGEFSIGARGETEVCDRFAEAG